MKIFLLGSCRIQRPVRRLDEQGRAIFLNKPDPNWFLHTVRGAAQSLQVILGEVDPPLHLRTLIFETDDERIISYRAPELVDRADVVVIEHCTMTSLDLDGWEINPHRYHHALDRGDQLVPAISKGQFSVADIVHNIAFIKQRARCPIVVVGHIGPTGTANLDDARQHTLEALQSASQIEHFEIFDPREVIKCFPADFALDDAFHYAPQFERVIGEAMLHAMQQAVA